MEKLRRGPQLWHLTWPIAYEFMRVITHRNVLPRPWTLSQAWRFVKTLIASPSLVILAPTDRHPDLVDLVFGELPSISGNLLHDCHTVIHMREHGIRRICTYDSEFRRFAFLEVIEPAE